MQKQKRSVVGKQVWQQENSGSSKLVLLRSRKETLRRTEMCSELAKPVLGASFRGLAIVFAGLLAVRIVDALIFQDSHMTGAVSIMISSMVESLDQMRGEVKYLNCVWVE